MSAIDEILFPHFLVIFYFLVATWLLDNSKAIESTIAITEPKQLVISTDEIDSNVTIDNPKKIVAIDTTFSLEWLESQSLTNLKAIAGELCIVPRDRRSKRSWINAIIATCNKQNIVAIDLPLEISFVSS
jgi:hypothetical protein